MVSILETSVGFLEKGESNTPTDSQMDGRLVNLRLLDAGIIRPARNQIAATCPDAVEVEITLRFHDFAVRL
jgi:hypothetical protein